jgi:hypothetical protein
MRVIGRAVHVCDDHALGDVIQSEVAKRQLVGSASGQTPAFVRLSPEGASEVDEITRSLRPSFVSDNT